LSLHNIPRLAAPGVALACAAPRPTALQACHAKAHSAAALEPGSPSITVAMRAAPGVGLAFATPRSSAPHRCRTTAHGVAGLPRHGPRRRTPRARFPVHHSSDASHAGRCLFLCRATRPGAALCRAISCGVANLERHGADTVCPLA
jgi:hypothetical protein